MKLTEHPSIEQIISRVSVDRNKSRTTPAFTFRTVGLSPDELGAFCDLTATCPVCGKDFHFIRHRAAPGGRERKARYYIGVTCPQSGFTRCSNSRPLASDAVQEFCAAVEAAQIQSRGPKPPEALRPPTTEGPVILPRTDRAV